MSKKILIPVVIIAVIALIIVGVVILKPAKEKRL